MTRALRQRYGHSADRVRLEAPKEPGGWWVASIPGVPGAYSQGHTPAEARAMLQDALEMIGKP